ncbi:MAG: acylphosphatase [Tissierellia bacterium]|nr:acylphosphatase [Tissierellia bacterium]
MTFKKKLRKFQNNYVSNKVKNTVIPKFKTSPIVRKKIIFSGKVQKVGFRFETFELANKLELKGYVKNTNNNTVELEVQGEEERIDFLIKNMINLKRAKVVDVEIVEIPLLEDESDFIIIKG